MTENIIVAGDTLSFKGKKYKCALGKNGISSHKREGDNCTPKGKWPLREVFYRSDKVDIPRTILQCSAIQPYDGWCDAPEDINYNKKVKLPYPTSHEKLYREDNLYNIVVVLGYNDAPPIIHKGSAIFMHVAKPEYQGTEGCIALKIEDLLEILAEIDVKTQIEIS